MQRYYRKLSQQFNKDPDIKSKASQFSVVYSNQEAIPLTTRFETDRSRFAFFTLFYFDVEVSRRTFHVSVDADKEKKKKTT